ncbi:hypothetical protein [Rufibacter sp. LB8]|uniref:hypothetical protein n=1 Tax=Rufibacter sp. LB8 TaxID=2777781 RepID=UPI00178C6127|nr:hypothetical protein [Rufibacter sp. LB8]
MKTLQNLLKFTGVCLLLLVSTVSFAQQGQGQGARLTPAERTQMQLDRYQKQLELTPEQATKIKDIILASAQEVDKMRTEAGGDGNRREALQSLNQKRNEQIKAVLSDAQKEKFDKMLAEQQDRMQNRGGQGGARGNN